MALRDARPAGDDWDATLVMAWRAHTVIGEEPEGDVRRVRWVRRGDRWLIGDLGKEWRCDFQVLRHDAAVRLEPDAGRLAVDDALTLRFAGETRGPVHLYLLPDLAISAVAAGGRPAQFTRLDGVVSVDLPEGLTGRDVALRFQYSGVLPAGRYALARAEPGSAFALRTWYWLPAVPRMRSAARVTLDVPVAWSAISAGRETPLRCENGRRVVAWEPTLSSPFLSFTAGAYVRAGEGSQPECLAFAFADHAAAGRAWAKRLRQAVQFYARLFGPYPFAKLALVEVEALPGAHASQSTIELPSHLFARVPPSRLPSTVAHEVAHQWFPYVAGARPRDYMFLAEGLAEYASWLYADAHGRPPGDSDADGFLRLAIDGKDLPLLDCPLDGAYYHKAAMVQHMLHDILGDARFRQLLRRFRERHTGENATSSDYRRAAEEVYGRPLDWFFRQWVEGRGLPTLALADVTAEREGSHWRVRGTLIQRGSPFRLLVPLCIEGAGEREMHTVWADAATTRLALRTSRKPLRLSADPGGDLLRLPAGPITAEVRIP